MPESGIAVLAIDYLKRALTSPPFSGKQLGHCGRIESAIISTDIRDIRYPSMIRARPQIAGSGDLGRPD